jgi:hypothetical protein
MAVYRPKYRDAKTGELVSGSIWWYEFTYAGERIRESSKQTKKTLGKIVEDNRRKQLEQSHAGISPTDTPKSRVRTVKAALAAYEKTYGINHRQKSVDVISERSPHLLRHLSGGVLQEVPKVTARQGSEAAVTH